VDTSDLTRSAVDVLPEGGLEAKLKLGRPLRVKLGIDPTSPDVHFGFAFVLDRLAAFQRHGHTVVLIVGDYTARIGDPSGRSAERPVLPDEVLDANASLFAEQAYRVLDPERTEVRFNGEWLGRLTFAEVVRLTRTLTLARLLERDDFEKRFAAHVPISLSELLYPPMQAYDSVAVEADVEIGGTDQLFNLLAGREVMPHYGLEPQLVITFPLLVGIDGEEKMSKSKGNYIGIAESPEEQFGKTMSIPDKALPQWWEMLVGEAPFSGDSPVAVMFKQVHDALPDVPRDVVSLAVMRVIRTAAAKQPSSRFNSASAFVDALGAAMEDGGGPRRLQGRVAAAAAVLLIGAAGAWLVQGRNSGPVPQPATSGAPTRDVVLLAPTPAPPPDATPPIRPATIAVARPSKRSAAPPTVVAMPDAPPPQEPLPAAVSPQSLGSSSAEPREAPEPVSSTEPPPDAAADELTPPVRVRAVEPVYPPLARAAQLEGDVVLQVLVGRDGKVGDIAVVVSIHPLLDEAAINAVRRYEYLPARRNGVPEARTIRIAVSFRMR